MEYNIKYIKGKFSCPICGKIEDSDNYFMVNHCADNHTAYELAQRILDSMSDVMMGGLGWRINSLTPD